MTVFSRKIIVVTYFLAYLLAIKLDNTAFGLFLFGMALYHAFMLIRSL